MMTGASETERREMPFIDRRYLYSIDAATTLMLAVLTYTRNCELNKELCIDQYFSVPR